MGEAHDRRVGVGNGYAGDPRGRRACLGFQLNIGTGSCVEPDCFNGVRGIDSIQPALSKLWASARISVSAARSRHLQKVRPASQSRQSAVIEVTFHNTGREGVRGLEAAPRELPDALG